MADDQNNIRNAELANESDTPHFDALFAQYATDNGASRQLATRHGIQRLPEDLRSRAGRYGPERYRRDCQADFLEWFEENADNIDDAPATPAQSSLHRTQQEDAYSELQSAMLDAKKQRKQADNDAQLLANRLAHLRAEDARAQKRIEEAKRRARED
ncbi:hypothetical protein GQ600_25025 [Phytophthora cactorum]|nr:hypothetical protein GQ600_25025 [Phytophthora cactorum]